jgi:SAM-dependent methyltransferase
MGRWSRLLAEGFLRWLGPGPGLAWLDVGCGTGALTGVLRELADPALVVACDPSEPFVEYARTRITDAKVSFVVAGADRLPERAGGFDCVVSGLVLNFFPDPRKAVQRMRERARGGGVVAAYVWDYAGRMEFLRRFWDEAVALDPDARALDEGLRFPLCRRDGLESVFRDAGLRDVRSEAIEIPTRFQSFADYWAPFLGGTGPAPSYVASLDEDRRRALRDRLEARLVAGSGARIELTARAWAARGDVS